MKPPPTPPPGRGRLVYDSSEDWSVWFAVMGPLLLITFLSVALRLLVDRVPALVAGP